MTTKYARNTDPQTSHEAATTALYSNAHVAVEEALYELGIAADHEIEAFVNAKTHVYSGQRLRTARAELEREHIVTYNRDPDGIPTYGKTPSGRRTLEWRLA